MKSAYWSINNESGALNHRLAITLSIFVALPDSCQVMNLSYKHNPQGRVLGPGNIDRLPTKKHGVLSTIIETPGYGHGYRVRR